MGERQGAIVERVKETIKQESTVQRASVVLWSFSVDRLHGEKKC